MPRGAPTRVISIRLDERLAQSIEERAGRAGKTLAEEVKAVCEGTFHYPGKPYSWAESQERAKLLRRIDELEQGRRIPTTEKEISPTTFERMARDYLDIDARAVERFAKRNEGHVVLYGITYGLVMFGGDEVNAYSVWQKHVDHGYRPLATYMTFTEALERIPFWREAFAKDTRITDDWTDQPCAVGQRVVYHYQP